MKIEVQKFKDAIDFLSCVPSQTGFFASEYVWVHSVKDRFDHPRLVLRVAHGVAAQAVIAVPKPSGESVHGTAVLRSMLTNFISNLPATGILEMKQEGTEILLTCGHATARMLCTKGAGFGTWEKFFDEGSIADTKDLADVMKRLVKFPSQQAQRPELGAVVMTIGAVLAINEISGARMKFPLKTDRLLAIPSAFARSWGELGEGKAIWNKTELELTTTKGRLRQPLVAEAEQNFPLDKYEKFSKDTAKVQPALAFDFATLEAFMAKMGPYFAPAPSREKNITMQVEPGEKTVKLTAKVLGSTISDRLPLKENRIATATEFLLPVDYFLPFINAAKGLGDTVLMKVPPKRSFIFSIGPLDFFLSRVG